MSIIHTASLAAARLRRLLVYMINSDSGVLLLACRMRAKYLLLTHFSARYPGMPPRLGDASDGPLIGLAFDYSRIRLGDMWKLNTYLPAIQHTFDDLGEEEPMEIDLTKLQ